MYHWRSETGIHSEEKQLCLRRIKAGETPVKRLFTTLLKQLSLDCFVCQCPSYNTKQQFGSRENVK